MWMMGAIVIATVAMAVVAWLASARPLRAGGQDVEPSMALAWRLALWLFLLAAVSGFSMGGRLQHTVGGADGSAGLPLLNWSRTLGDLRVSHFFAMHALQGLPMFAWMLSRTSLSSESRVISVATAAAAIGALSVATLLQAWAGRPFLR
jgi:hypothetical protein